MKTETKPWLSGFCTPGNPRDSHGRCERHPRRDGVPCSCACHTQPDPAPVVAPGPVSEDEWRVTGEPGDGYPPYDFIHTGPDAEEKARSFTRLATGRWPEGPFLHRRTVTRTPWEEA